MLNVQQRCHVLSAGARQRIDPRAYYDIACNPMPEFLANSVTDIAAIDECRVAQIFLHACEGARSEQNLVTSFRFHFDLVRNIDVSHIPTRSVDCITHDLNFLFRTARHNES
jgi:hypothetical protein